jgi:mannosyltransferase OCH1-like enzyme
MKIPRIFHQIWLGNEPMPSKLSAWGKAWKSMHKNWEIWLWKRHTDKEIESNGVRFTVRHPEMLERACHLSQMSNILRYELLEHFGGVYLDTDMEPIRTIESLLSDISAFAPNMHTFRDGHVRLRLGCAIFGVVPGHPWARDLVAKLSTINPSVHGSLGSKYFAQVTGDHPEVMTFEPHVFYATDRTNKESYAIHHFSSKWWPGSFKLLEPKATASNCEDKCRTSSTPSSP